MNMKLDPNLTVSAFMTPHPLTVDIDISLSTARERMFANNVRHLIVTKDGTLAGIVSSRDIALRDTVSGDKHQTVADAMTAEPFCCAASMPLLTVVERMERYRWGSAIVADQKRVVGLFTTIDACRALRSYIVGHIVEPLVPSQHIRTPEPREHVELSYHATDALRRHGCSPAEATGRLMQFP